MDEKSYLAGYLDARAQYIVRVRRGRMDYEIRILCKDPAIEDVLRRWMPGKKRGNYWIVERDQQIWEAKEILDELPMKTDKYEKFKEQLEPTRRGGKREVF